MRKLTFISVVLVVSGMLVLPSYSVIADEGVPWFGLIPYLLTGGPNKPPVAFFSADPTSGDVPLTVDFDASGSKDPDDSVVSYEWDFGDGGNGAGKQLFHTYGNAGKHTVTLTVEDKAGATDTFNCTITVEEEPTGNQPPNANFTASTTSGTAPLDVSFDASGSSDPDGNIDSYSWDFGDGSTGTGETVNHTYDTSGSYTAQLTVEDNEGATNSTTVDISVSSPSNEPPNATFTASPTSGEVPLEVSFDASGSNDPDGSIDSYEWDFDDNFTGTGESVDHTYDSSGTYNVELTVTDNDGATDSTSETISVSSPTNEPPNASFSATPTSGEAPLEVSFDASDSNDPDGNIESYSWDFGDGSTGTGETVTHTFDNAENYTVELTVTDNDRATDSTTDTISVSQPNESPNASFTASTTSGAVPLVVSFDASESSDPDGSISSYNWDFGDGSTGSGETISHTFDSAGDYTVELTVTDDDGASDSTSTQIEVTSVDPETTITSGPSGTIDYRDVTFEWTGSDEETATSNLIYSYILEGKDDSWSNWTDNTSKSYDLLNGDYTFKVKAKDQARNIDPSPATRDFSPHVEEPGAIKWSVNIQSIKTSPAVGPDGTIYVVASGGLYAITNSGDIKWSFSLRDNERSSPTVGPDGTIYVGSTDGNLYAITSEGEEIWAFDTGYEVVSSPALGPNGTIYVGEAGGEFFAIQPNGIEKWRKFVGHDPLSPAVGPNGNIYVESEGGLHAIDSQGNIKWKVDTGPHESSPPAIGPDGTIYVGSSQCSLYAISSDGTKKWEDPSGCYVSHSPVVGSNATVYYEGSEEVTAVNSDGSHKWSFSRATTNIDSSLAIGADGTIYVGYDDGLWAINSNGEKVWGTSIGSISSSAPAIGSDGTVYIGTYETLYAVYSESNGLANTPWPMFQHDPKHTGRAE